MKTKKKIVIPISILFISLFAMTSLVSAGAAEITSVDYPTEVAQGAPVSVKVLFTYSSSYITLHGYYVELRYSINSLKIGINAYYVWYAIPPREKRPSSVSFNLPTSEFKAGDTIRFEIRYSYLDTEDLAMIITDVVSDKYKINVRKATVTNGTSVTETSIGFGIALIAIIAVSIRRKKQRIKNEVKR